jgi:RNA polymerase sigma-70 factor (ECF subfamily)
VALSEIDRNLLERCLTHKPRAWDDFVDRFMGLIVHVINHTAQCRSIRLTPADREDLISEVFLAIVDHDFGVLRHFRRQSSLATYLTVVARRVVVRKLIQGSTAAPLAQMVAEAAVDDPGPNKLVDREHVEFLLGELDRDEAEVVRLFHLEGKTYQEISRSTGMPENSVGPMLSQARSKMRRLAQADQHAT